MGTVISNWLQTSSSLESSFFLTVGFPDCQQVDAMSFAYNLICFMKYKVPKAPGSTHKASGQRKSLFHHLFGHVNTKHANVSASRPSSGHGEKMFVMSYIAE